MLPLEEINKLQEAVKPLGYTIHGFNNNLCSASGALELYLHRTGGYVIREGSAVPGEVGKAGVVHNPNDGLQCAK